MSAAGSMLERTLRRDRWLVAATLAVALALSWVWLLAGAGMRMPENGEATVAVPLAVHALLSFAMWAVMMAAMMLPSAAPMLLLHATIARRRAPAGGGAVAHTASVAFGYLAVWTAFSLAATALQLALEQAMLLSPMLHAGTPRIAGAILVLAGLYQWTRWKHACLERCRSPLEFVLTRWRRGAQGAFRMGVEHGAFCVGCCWSLMLLLFAGGVMNLAWIVALTALVLVERIAPWGALLARAAGALLIVWGGALLV